MKKIFRFILNFFIFSIMACYVLIGLISAATLIKQEQVRGQGIGELKGILQAALDEERPGEVVTWVRFRPLEETAELIGIITPESGRLSSDIFFEFSKREMRLGHKEEALFWSQLARYRLRFDALRCGAPDSVDTVNAVLQLFPTPEIQDLLQERPDLLKKSIQQVLDFDAKYPARNAPSLICAALNRVGRSNPDAMAPRDQWDGIRKNLRKATENALREMNGKSP